MSREVEEVVGKYLDHIGEVFLAKDLREAYESLRKTVYAKPTDPDSLKLTDLEERRLAAMSDEDRQLAMEILRRAGSEEELQREVQRTADRLVEVLEEVKDKVAGRGGKRKGKKKRRGPYKTDYNPDEDRKLSEDWKAAKRSGYERINPSLNSLWFCALTSG